MRIKREASWRLDELGGGGAQAAAQAAGVWTCKPLTGSKATWVHWATGTGLLLLGTVAPLLAVLVAVLAAAAALLAAICCGGRKKPPRAKQD